MMEDPLPAAVKPETDKADLIVAGKEIHDDDPTHVSPIDSKTISTAYELPSNQLQWPTTMGRDEECELIANTILRVHKTEGSNAEILHVHGGSGTGKSSAIQVAYDLFLEKIDSERDAARVAWVCGKYDEQLEGARPFSAILDAVTDLYGLLEESAIDAIREHFTKEELLDLSAVIPLPMSLQSMSTMTITIQDSPEDKDAPANVVAASQKNDSNQFRTFLRLFRRMLILISSHYDCVAILIDDVQWMDDVSKELLASVLSDDKLTNFLFIASQRTGPEEPEFVIPETKFNITTLEIAPINEAQLNGLIASALNLTPSETQDLTDMIHRRAGGNTLFFVQFVELLCSKKLIHTTDNGQFTWDLKAIASKTQSTGNVADILVKKLTSLPFEIQIALIVAAHIGFRFKGQVLAELLENTELLNLFTKTEKHSYSADRYVTTLYSGLKRAQDTGLVEKAPGMDEYRFAHDRIQKSARTLLPKGKAGDKILAKLGTLLLKTIEARQAEPWMIFAATKLITKYADTNDIGKTRVAKLCLQAATAARNQSAYSQSAKYAETGCNKLGKQAWTQEYALALKLSCIAAEMYFAGGNMESSMSMVKKIEENAISVEHCFRAYNVLEEILGAQSDHEACVMESRKRLAGLGVTLPKKAGQGTVLTNLVKTKAMLKGRSAKHLENLPQMVDPKKRQAVRMLGHVGESYWQMGDDNGCASTCLIMLQVVLKHGICSEGIYAFTAYGVCLGHLGDIKESAAFFNLARKLSDNDDIALSITSTTEHNMGYFLTKPLANSPRDLLKASHVSARLGDIYRAGFTLRDVCPIGVFAGYRLNELEEKINYCVEFFKDYNQPGAWEHMAPWLQFADCIRGRTEDDTVLSGNYADKDKILDYIKDPTKLNTSRRVLVLAWHYCQNFVLLIHNKPEEILEEQEKFKYIPEEMGPNYQKIINCFNCALTHYSLAAVVGKKSSSSHHRGKARHYARVVKKHAAAGSPMLNTMCVVIDAEEAMIGSNKKGKDFHAIELYEQAAKEFGRQQMYLYKALTLERAARVDSDVRLRLLQDSYREYENYGAEAKCYAMRKENPSVNFPSPVPESVVWKE